jgi:uncharacterized protein YjdB
VSSDTPGVATVPPTIFIPAGANAASLPVHAVGAGTANITVAGSPGVLGASGSVTVTAPIAINLPSFLSVGQTVDGEVLMAYMPVTLSAPAPAGGVTVNLSNSDPGTITISTSSVFIPAGAMTPVNQPTITGQTLGFSTVTASSPGMITGTLEVFVSDEARLGMPFNVSVPLGKTVDLPITLPGFAPAGGITVFLTSSDPSVTVTPSVFIPAGSSVPAIEPQITGVSLGSSSVMAYAGGYTSVNRTVTVTPAPAGGQSITVTRSALRNAKN